VFRAEFMVPPAAPKARTELRFSAGATLGADAVALLPEKRNPAPVELVKITGPADVCIAELRERAAAIPLRKNRRQFVARDAAGDDVAFLSFDLCPGRDFLVLYELWVAKERRGAGVGMAALDAALAIARDAGHARLRAWYRRRGFTPWPLQRGVLQRVEDGR
jgi:GNAT superfamily N-acetyltransferase